MLDMGFIHDLRRIVASVPRNRQTLMFSATMPNEIRQLAAQWLRKPVHVQVSPEAAPAEKVEQSVCFVEPRQKPLFYISYTSPAFINFSQATSNSLRPWSVCGCLNMSKKMFSGNVTISTPAFIQSTTLALFLILAASISPLKP